MCTEVECIDAVLAVCIWVLVSYFLNRGHMVERQKMIAFKFGMLDKAVKSLACLLCLIAYSDLNFL